MIVLDDPANPFSLIFSIRKIPNDLLDLERLNRPGESVPSRESRTSTLKGLFLLEGPAAALCIRTADFRCGHFSDMPTALSDVRFWGAGSTGRRNTGAKSLCWGFKLQGLTWSFVELTSHFVQIGL